MNTLTLNPVQALQARLQEGAQALGLDLTDAQTAQLMEFWPCCKSGTRSIT